MSGILFRSFCVTTTNLEKKVMTFTIYMYMCSHCFLRSCMTIAFVFVHYNDVIMGAMASQITSLTIVYSTVYSGADQRKHQSSASLAFVRGIHRWPVNSPHKWPVTQKMFPFDDVIIGHLRQIIYFVAVSLTVIHHSHYCLNCSPLSPDTLMLVLFIVYISMLYFLYYLLCTAVACCSIVT